MAKKPQIAGRCVFCNGFRLTKEHIWSDWLTKRQTVPHQKTHTQSVVRVKMNHGDGTAYVAPDLPKLKTGPLIQVKIRRVCNDCNGGWMKDIVDAALPFAESMVSGRHLQVTTEAQRAVSAWIMLSCIMAEFTDEQTMAIPLFDRVHIRENAEPPSDWHIFVGRYEGTEWAPTRYRHHGAEIAKLPPGPFDISRAETHHFQVSTYVLGDFAVHAFSTTYAPLADEFEADFSPDGMERIWPLREAFAWPIQAMLDDVKMTLISETFFNHRIKSQRTC